MSTTEPCLEGVSEEIKEYIEKLKEENDDKEITLRNRNTEMKHQISYNMELEIKLEKCFHLITFLRSTIYQLDSDDFNNDSPDQSKIQEEISDLKEEMRSWRVKAKTSNLDRAILKSEVNELKGKLAEYKERKKENDVLKLVPLNANMLLQSTGNNKSSRLVPKRRKRRK